MDVSDFDAYKGKNNDTFIYSQNNNIEINEKVYNDLVATIRKINLLEKVKYKPGNESARKYLLKKERKKQKRNAKKNKNLF